MNMRILFPTLIVLPTSVSSFIFQTMRTNGELLQFVESQTQTDLNLRLILGRQDESQMGMDGLLLRLFRERPEYKHPLMPGANGPHPKLSGGVRSLKILEEPRYVGSSGIRHVKLLNGCWEMVWREEAPAGSIICGFDVPEEERRNDVVLPSGRLYVNFPVFSKDGIDESRAHKKRVGELAEQYIQDRKEELGKMAKTNNPLLKALYYRNALNAAVKLHDSGFKQMADIPLDDVMPIPGGLLLCGKGTVWTKNGSFHRGDHVLLGHALVSTVDMEEKP